MRHARSCLTIRSTLKPALQRGAQIEIYHIYNIFSIIVDTELAATPLRSGDTPDPQCNVLLTIVGGSAFSILPLVNDQVTTAAAHRRRLVCRRTCSHACRRPARCLSPPLAGARRRTAARCSDRRLRAEHRAAARACGAGSQRSAHVCILLQSNAPRTLPRRRRPRSSLQTLGRCNSIGNAVSPRRGLCACTAGCNILAGRT